MSSAPPPYRHPGSPPLRPEVPEGVQPAPGPWPSPPVGAAPPKPAERASLPAFAAWAPFAAGVAAYALAIVALSVILGAVSATGDDIDFADPPSGAVLGATLVQDILLVVLAVLLARVTVPKAGLREFGIRTVPFWRGFGWALAVFGMFYLFTFAWSAALGVSENDDLAQELGASDNALNLVTVAVLVGIVAPIAEELFFRGFLFTALWRALGWIPGALIAGGLFGLIHAGGTPAVFLVPLAALGFLLCWLYRKTGSLLPGMGVHAFNNALALGVTLHWDAWQVLLAIVLAPAVVVGLASQVAQRAAVPAPA
jgi:membrane protease YdiL (CAAX protease family)